jgi:hypothetical protein
LNGNNSPSNGQPLGPDLAEIRRALDILCQPHAVYELRAIHTCNGTVAGYFDNLDSLAAAAAQCSSVVYKDDHGRVRAGYKAQGVYITLNPVLPALLARSANSLKEYVQRDEATNDEQILKRRWLPIDCDFKRASGISSTDAEHDAAIARAVEIRDYLISIGWDDGVLLDSGNGGHVLFPLDLPNDDASTELVKRILKGLNAKFGRDGIVVDEVNYNASRIWKVPGTVVRKGSDMPDRPHRLARGIP